MARNRSKSPSDFDFTMRVAMGNDAMQTWSDLAIALETIAAEMKQTETDVYQAWGTIQDLNGNRVGEWKVR